MEKMLNNADLLQARESTELWLSTLPERRLILDAWFCRTDLWPAERTDLGLAAPE
jgi:hypothetical protein